MTNLVSRLERAECVRFSSRRVPHAEVLNFPPYWKRPVLCVTALASVAKGHGDRRRAPCNVPLVARFAVQNSPPSYQADPSVYKVIFEDANFRIIEAVRKADVKDKPHSHPVPSVIYNVTDCSSKL